MGAIPASRAPWHYRWPGSWLYWIVFETVFWLVVLPACIGLGIGITMIAVYDWVWKIR